MVFVVLICLPGMQSGVLSPKISGNKGGGIGAGVRGETRSRRTGWDERAESERNTWTLNGLSP